MMEVRAAKRERGPIDRISQLPEFLLHMILSVLDPKEAGRASVLSKRWYAVWSSVPVLDFRLKYLKGCIVDVGFFEKYVGLIDKAMQRYSMHNHRIRKLHLEFPTVAENIEPLVDKWIEIAVQNKVEELSIEIIPKSSRSYRLPAILFEAKSLRVLNCENVNIPYYDVMNLISLESLTLTPDIVDVDMLQRIISFCPLTDLDISKPGHGKLCVPWARKVNEPSGLMQCNVKASSLRTLVYNAFCEDYLWQWKLNVGALSNLIKVEIVGAEITDEIVSEMVLGLVALQSLVLRNCHMLRCINISSISLKELRIGECSELRKARIDAPNLLDIWLGCNIAASLSLFSPLFHCNAQFCPILNEEESISTTWFVTLKMFLMKASIFKCLMVDMSDCDTDDQIVIDEDLLKNTVNGPPYKLRELNVLETRNWLYDRSSLTAFLDGLFWICHPDVLLLTIHFKDRTAEAILDYLKDKVECWKHPLKSIEVEGAELSTLLSTPSNLPTRFRLSWKSFEPDTE